jgi:hypothetical protein
LFVYKLFSISTVPSSKYCVAKIGRRNCAINCGVRPFDGFLWSESFLEDIDGKLHYLMLVKRSENAEFIQTGDGF